MELTVQHTPVTDLIPYARNARTHSDVQVAQIAASIMEFGFVNPVLIGNDNVIIAGHGRVLAAQKLDMKTVPTIMLVHLNENQRHALVIADNKLAENASWDETLLRLELQSLIDDDFNVDLLGFDDVDLDALLDGLDDEDNTTSVTEDDLPEPQTNPVSQLGQLWVLGNHRLFCGDATILASYQTLMQEEHAHMVFTDPPYNVNFGDPKRGSLVQRAMSKTSHRILNDNLGKEFDTFIRDACAHMLAYTQGAFYICMGLSELETLKRAFCEAGGRYSTCIMWVKNRFVLGHADYHNQYEPILYGWKEGSDHYWCGARDQSNVWCYDIMYKNHLHPTMKPVELVSRAIENSSQRGEVVLDPFAGSGTTLIAAEQNGRYARLMELNPCYVDVIIQRWQMLTGQQAYLEETKQAYDELLALARDEATDVDGKED